LEALADTRLAPLVQRAMMLGELDTKMRQSLSPTLAAHCRLANVTDRQLVFLVDAPVWKAKLRLEGPLLQELAAAAGFAARTLVVKVFPEGWTESSVEPTAGRPLSSAARESLRATALSINDPELRAQLLKLASLP
jgi:hypothetical protein